jgi:glycogen debranching enzyme
MRETKSDEHITGVYKDVVNASLKYEEFRFRPNALITLAVAPDLCEPHHAKTYLRKVEEHLLKSKSIGVGTLSDNHNFYSSYYDNSNDSTDRVVAHGFSYHNGPEWVWPYGFYLVAKMNFEADKLPKRKVMTLLQEHIKHIQGSEWQSLTELTNRNGEYNKYSCPAQAWSISSILMALRKIEQLPFDE